MSFSLVAHELLTNALKYGALSGERGTVTISAGVESDSDGQRLLFEWRETGGPAIDPAPAKAGFGTRLTDRLFAQEFGAEIHRDLAGDGMVFRALVPLARILEQTGGEPARA